MPCLHLILELRRNEHCQIRRYDGAADRPMTLDSESDSLCQNDYQVMQAEQLLGTAHAPLLKLGNAGYLAHVHFRVFV